VFIRHDRPQAAETVPKVRKQINGGNKMTDKLKDLMQGIKGTHVAELNREKMVKVYRAFLDLNEGEQAIVSRILPQGAAAVRELVNAYEADVYEYEDRQAAACEAEAINKGRATLADFHGKPPEDKGNQKGEMKNGEKETETE
jgi:hypothetical protein